MKLRVAVLPLVLLGAAFAQDAGTAPPPPKSAAAPACREDGSDQPGCVTAPRVTFSPAPEYPEKERKARREGTVALWVIVAANGLPREVTIAESLSSDFDAAAIKAVKKWKFSPATEDGKPVTTMTNVKVTFELY